MTKDQWLKWYDDNRPNVNKKVINFIANILYHGTESNDIYNLFMNGYCYYFALMLQNAFGGEICWHKNHGHIVWKDTSTNNLCYDIGGLFEDYTDDEIIPISELSEAIFNLEDFRHR